MFLRILLPAVAALALGGCAQDAYTTLDAPKQFFAENKIGSSPDFGVIKFGDPADHVITVHGFADDAASCREVAEALNTNACKENDGQNCLNPYSCLILNQ